MKLRLLRQIGEWFNKYEVEKCCCETMADAFSIFSFHTNSDGYFSLPGETSCPIWEIHFCPFCGERVEMVDSPDQTPTSPALTPEQKDFLFHRWAYEPRRKFFFCCHYSEEIRPTAACRGCWKSLSEEEYYRISASLAE